LNSFKTTLSQVQRRSEVMEIRNEKRLSDSEKEMESVRDVNEYLLKNVVVLAASLKEVGLLKEEAIDMEALKEELCS